MKTKIIPMKEIDHFIVTGRYYNSERRFRNIYSSVHQAMGINLWNGNVWAKLKSGKRVLIKQVRN